MLAVRPSENRPDRETWVSISLCFVCLGNICRSPTAEGIMLALVENAGLAAHIEVGSAGVEAYHVGEKPDLRSRQCAARRGIDLTSRARAFEADDLDRFEYILAMDTQNHRDLAALAAGSGRPEAKTRIRMLRSFEPDSGKDDDVPDPYYGGEDGFDRVFDICDRACRGLLAHIRVEHDLD
jgi:protein-tyrosine phosphatase